MDIPDFIKNYQLACSIFLFLIIFFALYFIKPKWLFNEDGSIREFGIGYMKKTILPLWLIGIILAILSYTFVNFICNLHS